METKSARKYQKIAHWMTIMDDDFGMLGVFFLVCGILLMLTLIGLSVYGCRCAMEYVGIVDRLVL